MSGKIEMQINDLVQHLTSDLAEFSEGCRFFSMAKLQARHSCSRRVLEHALRRMEKNGLICIKPQSGIFVTQRNHSAVKERRITVIHTDWAAEYWMTLDAKFEAEFSAVPGYRFIRSYVAPNTEHYAFRRLLTQDIGDVALVTYSFSGCTQQDVAAILASKTPLVFLENHLMCRGVNAIDSMPEYSGMLAAEHLLRNGHRKIGLLVADSVDLCLRRELDGFIRYLQLHGVTPQTIDCRHPNCESSLASTEECSEKFLRRHGAVFTACFTTSVFAAMGFYRAAQSLGYSIPDDFSVITNSDVPSATRCSPPLTAIARDFDGYMREAKLGIERLFRGESFGIRRVPSLLIERASVRNLNKSAGSPGK